MLLTRHNPPLDILAYKRQYCTPSSLLTNCKVPQPNAVWLGHFATIWLNSFPRPFLVPVRDIVYIYDYICVCDEYI